MTSVSAAAYATLCLHASRWPSCAVNGVLLGPAAGAQGSPPSSPRGGAVCTATGAVPLFHSQLTLAPLYELALTQVEAHAKAQGLAVVGYYHANERASDSELSPFARRLADVVAKTCPTAFMLLADADALAQLEGPSPPVAWQLFTRDGVKGTWQRSERSLALAPSAQHLTACYYGEGRARRVVDFEDHLEVLEKDWLNPTLLS